MTDHNTDEMLDDEHEGRGRTGSIVKTVLVTAVIIVLLAVVLFLLAERNSRRYFLVSEGGELLVQRGIFFPVGEKRFSSDDPEMAEAYAPIPMPSGAEVDERRTFDERTELDRQLVDQLLSWARGRIDLEHPERLEQGIYYLRRAERIPTATSGQRQEMELLRGEVAYHEGRRFIELALRNLDTARERLMAARDSPAGWGRESRALLSAIREPEQALRQALQQDEATREAQEPPSEEPREPARSEDAEGEDDAGEEDAGEEDADEGPGSRPEPEAPAVDEQDESPGGGRAPVTPEPSRTAPRIRTRELPEAGSPPVRPARADEDIPLELDTGGADSAD
ncbi:MAG: hypothetical protein ACOCVR_02760 [Myxococcota bacterium]